MAAGLLIVTRCVAENGSAGCYTCDERPQCRPEKEWFLLRCIIEADAYYIHFRMIVAHLLQLSESDITTKKASHSVSTLNKATGTVLLTGLAAFGVGAVIALAQKATGISGCPTGLFSNFIALASGSLLKKK